jgi:putative ABC transport system ATP-binding protein
MNDDHTDDTSLGSRNSGEAVALEAVGLTKIYGAGPAAVHAIDEVSLRVARGEMLCVMGKSGSGKSTLLHQLGLLDHPTDGSVLIDGVEATALPEAERGRLRLEQLGYVFQEYALLPELTAEENVYLPGHMLGMSRRDCRERARELLELVGLSGRARHRPGEMSGGEQQRIAIARALMNEPEIVFADEPTASLDTLSTKTVMDALTGLNRDLGVTVVFVSHDPDHRKYATSLVFLRDGRIVEPYF